MFDELSKAVARVVAESLGKEQPRVPKGSPGGGQFGSGGGGGNNAIGAGGHSGGHVDSERIKDGVFRNIAAKLGFDTLETRNSDGLDFKEVSVWGLHDGLKQAYQAGSPHADPSSKGAASTFRNIGAKLGFDSMKTRNSDAQDFHEISVWGLKDALNQAHSAGKAAHAEKAAVSELSKAVAKSIAVSLGKDQPRVPAGSPGGGQFGSGGGDRGGVATSHPLHGAKFPSASAANAALEAHGFKHNWATKTWGDKGSKHSASGRALLSGGYQLSVRRNPSDPA